MARTLTQALKPHGFVYSFLPHNGVECWERRAVDGFTERLTAEHGESLPRWDSLVVIETGEVAEIYGVTMRDIVAALENPSTDYVSIALRIANDFHKGDQ